MTTAPGEGERRALRGYVPQLKVAAARILEAFERGTLLAVALADPEAGRVDDLQLLTGNGSELRLDAFQVKWSGNANPLADAELRQLIVDSVAGRRLLADAWAERPTRGNLPIGRYVVHIHTNRPISTATLRGTPDRGRNLTVPRFLSEVWRPAQHGVFRALEDIPEPWRDYVTMLAREADVDVPDLLGATADVLIEADRSLPEDLPLDGWKSEQFLRDVKAFVVGLLEAVTDDRKLVVLEAGEFLDIVGDEYSARLRPRSLHAFPVPPDFQPMRETEQALEKSLANLGRGYLIVTGSPGSGKSTLLTRVLTGDRRLAARYYAFVPGADTATRGEAHAFLHDLLLGLEARDNFRSLAPPRDQIPILRQRVRDRLHELGSRAQAAGSVAIVLIDGLDHVRRDPRPETPLLNELLSTDQLPEGVLFVLGTRNTEDLPAHVQAEAALPGRHIHMAPMDRRATRALASHAGLEADAQERVWQLSNGHPLLARTFTKLAASSGITAGALDVLADIPSPDGEVTRYYETIWAELRDDPDLVGLLGLICRLRAPVDFAWLHAGGTPEGTLERLERLAHLFTASPGPRWTFFHDSFREYLMSRTALRLGANDPAKERALHSELARRCSETPPDRPEAWEELHHRLRAGDAAGVLRRATPDFFRTQLQALRPPDDVLPDVCEAAEALSVEHDPTAVVQLALSAAECGVRGYRLPVDLRFLELLIDLRQGDAALAHLRHVDDNVLGNNRTATALDLAVALHDRGLKEDAERVFGEYEPLELLASRGASQGRRGPNRGLPKELYAWGAAAALIRGSKYVIDHSQQIVLSRADIEPREDVAAATAELKANILWAAAETVDARRDRQAADELLFALPSNGISPSIRAAVLVRRARDEWFARNPMGCGARLDEALARADVHLGSGDTALDAAALLVRLGRPEAARGIAATLGSITVPEGRYTQEERGDWLHLLKRLRLEAATEGPLDPVTTIPDGSRDFHRPRVIVARHLVRLANLWARALLNDSPAASEVIGVTRNVLALWDNSSESDRRDLWRALDGRRTIIEGAAVLAGEVGSGALTALWQWWSDRWATAHHRRDGGLELVHTFADSGIGPLSLRSRLDGYAAALEDDRDAGPEEWAALASARLSASDEAAAREALERCMALTFAVGYRKDYQLSTWVRLLRPLLHGRRGNKLGAWLVDRISDVERTSDRGASHHAARTLTSIVGEERPADVLALGQALRDCNAFDVDDVVEAVLGASAASGDHAWWIVLGELLVPLGGGPLELDTACAATPERDQLVRRLREIVERVAIEGRPTERRAWRQAISKAGLARGITSTNLGIADVDLEVGDETPDREAGETSTHQDEALTKAQEPVDGLLDRLEAGDRGYEGLRPAIKRLAEFSEGQRARLLLVAEHDEDFTRLAEKLAAEAMDAGRDDDAWHWAERGLSRARGVDWNRHYSGGPALAASRILQRLDNSRARPMIFNSFAAAAAQDPLLLRSIAEDLDEMLDIFDPVDEGAVAEVVLEYVVALSGAAAPTFDIGDRDAGAAISREGPLANVTVQMGANVVAWLLAMIHLVAWSSAQRAAVAMLRQGGATAEAMLDALLTDDAGAPPERILGVLRAALRDSGAGIPNTARVVAWLQIHAVGPRLDLREAAAHMLRRLEAAVPVAQPRTLPAGLRLIVSRAPEMFTRAAAIGAGDLDDMLDNFDQSTRALARAADVDPEALAERIRGRAEQLAALMPTDQELAARQTVLGWGLIRPTATAAANAQHEVAAELVDAERVSPADALAALGTLRSDFADALLRRPGRRPPCVPAAAPLASRVFTRPDWFDGIATAPERLAVECDSWTVIAELTELSLLDHKHSREEREQALVLEHAQSLFAPVRRSLDDARNGDPPRPHSSLITRNLPARPSLSLEYVALHPAAARAAGFEPDSGDPLAWRLNGEVAVRVVWWRSGFLSWQPYSDRDEVGDGWLVVAQPAAVEALLRVFPGARMGWVVRRRLRDADGGGELPAQIDVGERLLRA